MSIKYNKTKGNYKRQIKSRTESNDAFSEINRESMKILHSLAVPSKSFNPDSFLNILYRYALDNRISYSVFTSFIYTNSNDRGMLLTNLDKTLEKLGEGKKSEDEEERKQQTRKILIKLYDHINLAIVQFDSLKQTDEEYKEKFDKNIEMEKREIMKDMSAQLITLVGIFTAIAFVVFGGISTIDNIFEAGMSKYSTLKVVAIGSTWGIVMINMLFVFLSCVSQMTKLKFSVADNKKANLFEKYPLFTFSNWLLGSILIISLLLLLIDKYNLATSILNWITTRSTLSVGIVVAIFVMLLIIGINLVFKKTK